MSAIVRDIDVIGRWGGEEFLVVLPDPDATAAALVAEWIRREVAALTFAFEGGPTGIPIISGVAAGKAVSQAIARADAALYDGKRSGRNRVVVAAEPSLMGQNADSVTP